MVNNSKSLLVITNLYPVPWGPNRASFNKQQFDLLNTHLDVKIIVLLPWKEWLSHRKECEKSETIKYSPYFYIPKFGRRIVPIFQCISLLFHLSWIKKQRFSAVLASWGFPDAVAVSMLNKFIKLPFFVKVHGTDVNENSQFLARSRLMKKWLNKANTIFCASQALADVLQNQGIDKSKLSVNYNGVNSEIFYPLATKPNRQHFLFVGSLIATKGCAELLNAFIVAQKNNPDMELDILGEGPMKSILAKKINDHQLTDKVRLHGSVPLAQVAEHIRRANVLVLPSYREGVPNVLLEAFAGGTPVISTRVGGIPEVVNENVGLLIDAKNDVQLAQAMEQALSIEWSVEAILQHASQFDWQKNVDHVLEKIGE
ncbi:glycosyltransferase family 4 protein [Colwellia sp. Arc7-635]|uniref:glycosyltransferase n=1 Tax=Colwellia sp. Arc7-635 TaxID=2497879 RepID=UPI000F858DBE|nr:glycosyltransferase [Colwellia sp. Arc7-635]AZQ82857.1 glycosyltransferase family 4 protein [Colwellia sp. Arc7-635]